MIILSLRGMLLIESNLKSPQYINFRHFLILSCDFQFTYLNSFIFVKNGRSFVFIFMSTQQHFLNSCSSTGSVLINCHPFYPSVPQQLSAFRRDVSQYSLLYTKSSSSCFFALLLVGCEIQLNCAYYKEASVKRGSLLPRSHGENSLSTNKRSRRKNKSH